MCRYFWIGFVDFILKNKLLLEYTNIFFNNECKINDKLILKYFQYISWKLKWKKSIVLLLVNIEKLKTLKYQTCSKKN